MSKKSSGMMTAREMGHIGGLTTISRHGADNVARRAREGFYAKFEREVDPDGVLPVAERTRRADAALKAHMARMSAKAKAARAAKRKAASDDE